MVDHFYRYAMIVKSNSYATSNRTDLVALRFGTSGDFCVWLSLRNNVVILVCLQIGETQIVPFYARVYFIFTFYIDHEFHLRVY